MNPKRDDVEDGLPRPVLLTLAHIDGQALGIAFGSVAAFWIFIATVILIWKGGDVVGPNLYLLSQYFIGYSVTLYGSVIGALYGFLVGFITGFSFASLRNHLVHGYLVYIYRRAQQDALNDLP